MATIGFASAMHALGAAFVILALIFGAAALSIPSPNRRATVSLSGSLGLLGAFFLIAPTFVKSGFAVLYAVIGVAACLLIGAVVSSLLGSRTKGPTFIDDGESDTPEDAKDKQGNAKGDELRLGEHDPDKAATKSSSARLFSVVALSAAAGAAIGALITRKRRRGN